MDGNDNAGHPSAGPGLHRREVLQGAFGLVATTSAVGVLGAQAQSTAVPAISDADFLRLSKAATGHTELSPVTASRMFAAMRHVDATAGPRLAALLRLWREGEQPEELLAAADPAGLAEIMHGLVSAWYTGTVGSEDNQQVVAYFDTLMYRTVSDGLPVPTYCSQSGIWWEGDPPPVGIEPPRKPPGNVTP